MGVVVFPTTARPGSWMYHSVSPSEAPDPHLLRVHPRRLGQQLTFLRRLGVRGMSMRQALDEAHRGVPGRRVALTFDDGYADFLHEAMPVLERFGMTASVYLVAGRIGGRNEWDDDSPQVPLLTADEIREVATAGHEIGSHSMTHVRLAEVPAETVRTEVTDSRAVLEDLLQQPVPGFCYPYGSHDDVAVAEVERAGYDYACAASSDAGPGPLRLPRYYVGQQDTAVHLLAKVVRQRVRRRASRA